MKLGPLNNSTCTWHYKRRIRFDLKRLSVYDTTFLYKLDCYIAGFFFPAARALIGYFEVT